VCREFPQWSDYNNYSYLIDFLARNLHAAGKQLTGALVAGTSAGDTIMGSLFQSFDWINIMNYDNTGGIDQSTYNSAQDSLNYCKLHGREERRDRCELRSRAESAQCEEGARC
jgi:GH18 family chitinase